MTCSRFWFVQFLREKDIILIYSLAFIFDKWQALAEISRPDISVFIR